MNHFVLLLYFLPLCIGFFTLGLLSLIYLKNNDSLLRLFLLFFLTFTIQQFSTLFLKYLKYNSITNLIIPVFIIDIICSYSIMFIGILIFHELIQIKYKKTAILIFLIILISSLIIEFIEDLKLFRQYFMLELSKELVFILIIAYCLTGLYFNRKNLKRFEIKIIIKSIIIILSFTLFFFVLDLCEDLIGINIPISPFHYLTWNLFSLFFILKYYSNLIFNKVEIDQERIAKFQLSKREVEILNRLIKGHSYKKISDECFISISTVKTHVSNIYLKMSIKSRYELYSIIN